MYAGRQTKKDKRPKKLTKMKTEVFCACAFFSKMLQTKNLPVQFVDVFRSKLEGLLIERFKNHWDAANPNKGSAYRCIRINNKMDPVVEEAAKVTGLTDISKYLPAEFTMWVDPDDVSYRFGEEGSICSCPLDFMNRESGWVSSPNSKYSSKPVRDPSTVSSKPSTSPVSFRSHHHSSYSYVNRVYSGLSSHIDYAIPVQV